MRLGVWRTGALAATLLGAAAAAQETAQIDFESVGRGAPLAADIYDTELVGAAQTYFGPPQPGDDPRRFVGTAQGGATPEGIEPLEVDLFTSKDFYQDKEL